jgi:hypothetical protein
MRKLLFYYSLYSHPEIENFRVGHWWLISQTFFKTGKLISRTKNAQERSARGLLLVGDACVASASQHRKKLTA